LAPACERHGLVAVALAGHGASGTGRAAWTMAAFGGDVAAVVDRLRPDDVVPGGHSMGGDAILNTASERECRVCALAWVDTYRSLGAPINPEEDEAFIAGFRRDFTGEVLQLVRGLFPPAADADLAECVAADMAAAPPEIALEALRNAIANEGPAIERLAQLGLPAVAINPDYRPTDADSLRRHGVETVILRGVGHFSM